MFFLRYHKVDLLILNTIKFTKGIIRSVGISPSEKELLILSSFMLGAKRLRK